MKDTDLAHSWPKPTGVHSVGIVSFDLIDESRSTARGTVLLPSRSIQVYAWYPAINDGREPRTYFTKAEASVLPITLNRLYGMSDDALDHCMDITTCSLPDASAKLSEKKYPLLVFCHGFFSFALQNTALMEELASHGYVVLSVAHPYESGGVLLSDGEGAFQAQNDSVEVAKIMTSEDIAGEFISERLSERIRSAERKIQVLRGTCLDRYMSDWTMDQLFAVDSIQEGLLPQGASFLECLTDTKKVGYFGMSYGGAVATELCDLDPRAAAGINLDGGLWSTRQMDRQSRTPFLLLHSDMSIQVEKFLDSNSMNFNPELLTDLNPNTPLSSDLYYEELSCIGERQDIIRLALPGITHIGMTDLPIIAGADWRAVLGGGDIIGSRYIEIQNRVCLDFFDVQLKGKNTDFPKSIVSTYPEIVVRNTRCLQEQAQRIQSEMT